MHLYVHTPYCEAKCPYCDFNSIAGRENEFTAYVDALVKEISLLPKGPYETIFMGGGTPSLLPPQLLEKIGHAIRCHVSLADNYEWTMEANPGSVDQERFSVVKEFGVNRISLGVQSIYDHHLRFLGRVHDASEANRAVDLAQNIFPRVSADMMIALPHQTEQELREEIQWYKQRGLNHASVYHLAYEEGTEFHAKLKRGELREIDDEKSGHFLELVEVGLGINGLRAYETSNYAKPGDESRHNLAYWLQRDYHAVGAGAVSTVDRYRMTRQPHPHKYIEAINSGSGLAWKTEELSKLDYLIECWMLGLRLRQGVSLGRLSELGDDPQRWQQTSENLEEFGLIKRSDTHLWLTPAGRRIQDKVTVELLPSVDEDS